MKTVTISRKGINRRVLMAKSLPELLYTRNYFTQIFSSKNLNLERKEQEIFTFPSHLSLQRGI